MADDQGTARADDLKRMTDDTIGLVEEFIGTRPLTAVAIAMACGALLARHLFRREPNGVG